MNDLAIANRNRIGRLYGYTGLYGTTNAVTEPEEPEIVLDTAQAESKNSESDLELEDNMIFNRFKQDSIAGRILKALAGGPKTAAQLAYVAGSKSADNILAPGGWFYQLRKFGKTSGKFRLEKDGNRLVLTISKRYASQV